MTPWFWGAGAALSLIASFNWMVFVEEYFLERLPLIASVNLAMWPAAALWGDWQSIVASRLRDDHPNINPETQTMTKTTEMQIIGKTGDRA